MKEPPGIDVRCPECGYSPVKYVTEQRAAMVTLYGEGADRRLRADDLPETREDVLDFFEVAGADEGCIFCPVCSCEFDAETGELAATRLAP